MENTTKTSTFTKLGATALAVSVGVAMTACTPSSSGEAAEFPQRTIELIVPFSAGGPTDVIGRVVADGLSAALGSNGENAEVVVINRTGAAGSVGTSEVVNANSDGYTLAMVTGTSFGVQPHLESTPYGPGDLTPVAQVASLPNVLVVNESSDLETFDDFVQYAEENPNDFTYGTTGVGSLAHANFAALSGELGVETEDVPFDGNAPMINALMGNNIAGGVIQSLDAISHVEEGTFRALAVIGSHVPEGLDGTPLVSELGYDVSQDLYFGVMAPTGIDEEVRRSLESGIQEALDTDEIVNRFADLNMEPNFKDGEAFKQDIDDMGVIVQKANEANGGPLA